jgi:hypothetical protein
VIAHKEWKRARGRYASGEELWVGDRICVGHWFNPMRSKGEDAIKYKVVCHLPDIRIKEEYEISDNVERAKQVLEIILDRWYQRLTHNPRSVL